MEYFEKIMKKTGWTSLLTSLIFAILGILTFGIWGSNYDVAGFIYFQF